MNISTAITIVRDHLDDPQSVKYTDREIVRHVDEQARVMFRKQTQQNRDWHNFSLCIQKENAREIFGGTFEWQMPTWIDRVIQVYERDGSATAESTYSPYLWTASNGVRFGRKIDRINPTNGGDRPGWSWDGQHTLRLWRFTSAPELVLLVTKVPPPMFKVNLLSAYADASGAYLPAGTDTTNFVYGTLAAEEGAYINAEVQVTPTGATDTGLGAIRRVSYSKPNSLVSGAIKTEIRFDYNMPATLSVGDDLETLLPVPDAHARLLVLLVVNGLFIKKNNVDGMKAISGELAKEWAEFIAYATMPRDNAGPVFKTSRSSPTRRTSVDLWPGWGWPV